MKLTAIIGCMNIWVLRLPPPEPPWQLSKVKVNLVKGLGCSDEVLIHAIVSTDEAFPNPDLIPYIEDRPIENIITSADDWDTGEDGIRYVEMVLDEPLLVEEEGDLYLLLTSTFGACPTVCLSEMMPVQHFEDNSWQLNEDSIGLAAEIEW